MSVFCEVCKKPAKSTSIKIKGHAGNFTWSLCQDHDLGIVDGDSLTKAEVEQKIAQMQATS